MSMPVLDAYIPAAVWLIVKASLLIGAAAMAQALLSRRTSAATRHLVWSFAIAGLLLLPALSIVLPRWETGLQSAAISATTRTSRDAAAGHALAPSSALATTTTTTTTTTTGARPTAVHPMQPQRTYSDAVQRSVTQADGDQGDRAATAGARIPWAAIALLLYVAGAALLLARLAVERVMVWRLARQASEVRDDEWIALLTDCARRMGVRRPVRLLRSRAQAMPMAFGTRRPAVLIPSVAELWSDDRRRAVLLHELAHVARHDCLTQTLAAVASALYWPHPGVWWIARRLRVERELACDDRVLTVGTQPRDYAGHLLELAYALGGHRAPALAVSMARPQQLEGRMLAVLDAARNRATPGPRGRLAGLAITSALLLPLAAADATTVSARTAVLGSTLADEGESDGGRGGSGRVGEAVPMPAPLPVASPAPAASPTASPAPNATPGPTPATAADAHGAEIDAADESEFQELQLPGTWEMRSTTKPGYVHLRLTEGYRSSSSRDIALAQLEGLSAEQLSGTGGPVRFSLRREAGTLAFEGTVRGGVGGGMFAFTPNAAFGDQLEKRGIQKPMPSEQYELAKADIGTAYLDELTKQGYPKPTLEQLVRAGQHGVHFEYLREMGATGYRLGTFDTLIKFRDHGVTPTYIREMAAAGYTKLQADELLRARDHGVSTDYVREMRELGYGSLTLDQLVKARDHGVSADYVRAMGTLGYQKLSLDEVIRVRDHGVSADYIQALREQGFGSLPLDQVVNARNHGVSADYLKGMAALGFAKMPLDELIRVRDHGVSPDFIRAFREQGYTNASLDALVKAKDHGVSADFVKELTAMGYKNLPLDTVVRMRDHGVSTSFVRELREMGYDRVDVEDLVGLRDHGVSADKIRRANERAGTKLPLDMIRSLAR